MCLVFKLDNGKVVSIANEQTHSVAYYNIDVYSLYNLHAARFGPPPNKISGYANGVHHGLVIFIPYLFLVLKN